MPTAYLPRIRLLRGAKNRSNTIMVTQESEKWPHWELLLSVSSITSKVTLASVGSTHHDRRFLDRMREGMSHWWFSSLSLEICSVLGSMTYSEFPSTPLASSERFLVSMSIRARSGTLRWKRRMKSLSLLKDSIRLAST